MNIQDYLQMKAMENQQGQQPAQSYGNPGAQNVPRDTFSSKPLTYGSRAAVEAVRESIGNRTNDFTRSLGRLSANIGRGLYAKSGTKFGETMAQIPFDPYADEDARIKEDMEILEHIRRADQAQKEQERYARQIEQQYLMHQESLGEQARYHSEQARHNRAAEGVQNQLHAYEIENAKEGKVLADRIKEETGDNVQPMLSMKPQMLNYANKEIRTYADKANAAAEGIEASRRMREIAIKNPKILGSWDFVVAYKYAKDPGYVNQLLMSMNLSKKDKDDLLELASLSKTFNVKSLSGIPGKGINQMIERELFGANPSGRMSKGALLKMLDKADVSFQHGYEEYSKASEYGDAGFLYKPKSRKIQHGQATAVQPLNAKSQAKAQESIGIPALQGLSDEELDKMLGAN